MTEKSNNVAYDEQFKLRVLSIISDFLQNRALTVSEVESIKSAIMESWDLLIERHVSACADKRQQDLQQFNEKLALIEKELVKISQAQDTDDQSLQDFKNTVKEEFASIVDQHRHDQRVAFAKLGVLLSVISMIIGIAMKFI